MSEMLFANYAAKLNSTIKAIDESQISTVIDLLLDATHKNVFIAGNGGSAALASHFCTDLHKAILGNRNTFCPISLTDNGPLITAISNDVEYSEVFASQLNNLGRPGDILICISSSGNSQNLVQAVKLAHGMGASTIALTAFDGGILRTISNYSIHVPTNFGEYGIAEDIHSSICHFISQEISTRFKEKVV